MACLEVRIPAERLLAPMQPARPGPQSPGGEGEEEGDGAYADDFSVKSNISSPAKGSSARGASGSVKGVSAKGGKGKAIPAPATPTARATAAPATLAPAAVADTPLAPAVDAVPTTPASTAAASLPPIDTTPLPVVDATDRVPQPPPSAQTDGTQDGYGEDDFEGEGEDSLSMRSAGPGTYPVPFSKRLPPWSGQSLGRALVSVLPLPRLTYGRCLVLSVSGGVAAAGAKSATKKGGKGLDASSSEYSGDFDD